MNEITIQELIQGWKNGTVELIDTFTNCYNQPTAHFRTADGNNYYYFKDTQELELHN